MVRRKFDSNTRMLFADIQRQITVLDGQLLNRKVKNADALRSAKSSLQAKARELKNNYYSELRLQNFELEKIFTQRNFFSNSQIFSENLWQNSLYLQLRKNF
jgi:hypothetical protein